MNLESKRPVALPEGFTLPEPKDIDRLIDSLNSDVIEQGGPSAFLGKVRVDRIGWRSMEYSVLRPLSRHAFRYEDVGSAGQPPKTDLAVSRAALSGMLFGHMVNEKAYPNTLLARPYSTTTPINPEFIDQPENFTTLWENDQPTAYKVGVQAMSSLFIDSLHDSSLQTLAQWGGTMVGVDRMQHFNFGLGTSLYLAWDTYSDMLVAKGDVESVRQYINTNLSAS